MRVEPAARAAMVAMQGELLEAAGPLAKHLRPTHPDDLHATLKFLGTTRRDQQAEVQALIERAGAALAPIRAHVVGVDAFASPERPSAIFGRVGVGHEQIERLMGVLDAGCAGLGFPVDARRRVPHVTLLRAKDLPVGALAAALRRRFVCPLGCLQGDAIVLYQSAARGDGARYHALASTPVGARP